MISPRAIFQFDAGQLEALSLPPGLEGLALHGFVDLTSPPQRSAYRCEVLKLRGEGLTQEEAADRLGITLTAAQNAAKLDRRMNQLGVTDPWQPVVADTEAANAFKRISHTRYRFQPLDGFTPRFPETFPI